MCGEKLESRGEYRTAQDEWFVALFSSGYVYLLSPLPPPSLPLSSPLPPSLPPLSLLQVYTVRGDYNTAIKQLQKAAALDPEEKVGGREEKREGRREGGSLRKGGEEGGREGRRGEGGEEGGGREGGKEEGRGEEKGRGERR